MRIKEIAGGLLGALLIYLLLAAKNHTVLVSHAYLLSLVTFIYLAAAAGYLLHWIFKWEGMGLASSAIAWAGILLHTAGWGIRWWESHELGYGHIPLSNLYESLIFFAWAVMAVYLFLELKLRRKALGAFVAPVASLIMAYASFGTSTEIEPLVPALQSNWLTAHVITCFLGYGAFAVAFGLGLVYLFRPRTVAPSSIWQYLPEQETLDNLMYKIILFGFFWLTVGIITGAVWADQAWGSYWSWDPKETWSLITWFIYAAAIHARITRGWTGKRMAFLSVVGFGAVLFTYFGVNFWLSGLHSYASS
ncbi:c-type cytochrome biogenesis protein CcsB [Thermosulfurimonas dismutans]|uniref:Cytochrome c-type biogenesis protein CcsA/ResC n=1 Tax=Thermosulfurimonas dismutans TaxID=999894 RepID=A0A179D2H8_9BACT|nr:c-type cytochrome biogenesis protein CcsB [Thermosulfurimonas dismutans]OAQ20256.1 Cytochrome c-type biogenesis protein CcsA/ResC [Thermosulfurimonas dismutans]